MRLHTIYPDSRAFSSVGFVSLDLSRKLLGIVSPRLSPFFARVARRKFFGDPRRHRVLPGSQDLVSPILAICAYNESKLSKASIVDEKLGLDLIKIFQY